MKEQLTHFKTKKINEEEFKDPFAWWRTHEVHFPMFVLWLNKYWGLWDFILKEKYILVCRYLHKPMMFSFGHG